MLRRLRTIRSISPIAFMVHSDWRSCRVVQYPADLFCTEKKSTSRTLAVRHLYKRIIRCFVAYLSRIYAFF